MSRSTSSPEWDECLTEAVDFLVAAHQLIVGVDERGAEMTPLAAELRKRLLQPVDVRGIRLQILLRP